MSLFKGAATALITPFKDGKIDYVSMGKLIEWQINQGIDALVVCGTTGEASTLSVMEKLQLVRFAVDLTDGRVPVIAGRVRTTRPPRQVCPRGGRRRAPTVF